MAILIALINGYFCFYLLTQSVNTNLPNNMLMHDPMDAPTQTERKPTRIAFCVDLYAYLKAKPAPTVSRPPGMKRMEQMMNMQVRTNGP